MNREQLTRALRKYARKRNITPFTVDTKKGNGSHYRVRLGTEVTTIQQDLNPGRVERLLKQLKVDPRDL